MVNVAEKLMRLYLREAKNEGKTIHFLRDKEDYEEKVFKNNDKLYFLLDDDDVVSVESLLDNTFHLNDTFESRICLNQLIQNHEYFQN
jgi:hypothetical protein